MEVDPPNDDDDNRSLSNYITSSAEDVDLRRFNKDSKVVPDICTDQYLFPCLLLVLASCIVKSEHKIFSKSIYRYTAALYY